MDPTTSEELNPSTSTGTGGATRRRLTFRPPTSSFQPVSSAVPTTSSAEADPQNISPYGEMMQQEESIVEDSKEAPKRKLKPWSQEEVSAFYDAIKSHGKDFDSVVKALERKKIVKTKEQVKIFFFNSAKNYRQILSLTEEDLSGISRDARELFLLVNACEWKRKTQHQKMEKEKLRELLFEGSCNVKVGRKNMTIKTPPCPAICKYFHCRKADRIPTEVYVHLEPTSNGDHAFMRSRNHNPYLRVKMNTNDRIAKLLEFTHRKWTSNLVTLWPDSSCEVSSLCVQKVETSPYICVSLNKLKKHTEEMKERIEPKKPANALVLAADVNTKTKPTYTIYYPKPFALTDKIVSEGITLANVKSAIVAELFCVCGRKNPIQLRYQISIDNQESLLQFEPWRMVIDLLNRGYGESLANSKKEEERDRRRELREAEAAEPVSKKKKAPEDVQQAEIVPGNPVSEIVRMENEEFESQLAMLRKTQRQKVVSMKRKNTTNPVLSTGTPRLSVHPAMSSPTPSQQVPSKQVFVAPMCTMVPRRGPAKHGLLRAPINNMLMQGGQAGPSTSSAERIKVNPRPTDFSSVTFSPVKRSLGSELQRKQAAEFLSHCNRTDDSSMPTPQKFDSQLMFGDISMSPGSSLHASNLTATVGSTKDVSVVDFTELMYQNIDNKGEATVSNLNLEFSVSEVNQTYNDMMSSSQNSQDFIFQQFQKKKTTTMNPKNSKAPKK